MGADFHPDEVRDLAQLVDYAEGSVVSRTLVDRRTGTVTLFAFAQGEGLSEHTAPFEAFLHVLEGTAEVTLGGKVVQARAGEAVLMSANMPHALRAATRFKMLLTMIRSG